jgi:3-phosphoshikimate 1-carboxyvinyltransferase
MLTLTVTQGGCLQGGIRVPGDKSLSHRSIIFGSLAEGVTEIDGFLDGKDCLATLAAFRAMGVQVEGPEDGRVVIRGVGMHGLRPPGAPLDMGNSGTAMRLMAGLLAAQSFDTQLIGDASLSRRPMGRVAGPLSRMGARIETQHQGTPPLRIRGTPALTGIEFVMPVASAQVKSALLLAGMYAKGRTCITEPAPTRDHTERMMATFGYPVSREGSRVCLTGGAKLTATPIDVPADISSAAFFMVGAAIAPGSDIILRGVGINPTRIGIVNLLRMMGARIDLDNRRQVGQEPVADIHVTAGELHGIVIPEDQVPLAIDEFPALFIAAACATGRTVLTGAEELRVKESDRIAVMAEGLARLGIAAHPTPDGIEIQGGQLSGGRVDSHGDHRIAMAFAMAALRAGGPVVIDDCGNIETSFPGFAALAGTAGLRISRDSD